MNYVLDDSVPMHWFFGDGKPQELAHAGKMLYAMKDTSAQAPVTWGLEVSNVIARDEAKGCRVYLDVLCGSLETDCNCTNTVPIDQSAF